MKCKRLETCNQTEGKREKEREKEMKNERKEERKTHKQTENKHTHTLKYVHKPTGVIFREIHTQHAEADSRILHTTRPHTAQT